MIDKQTILERADLLGLTQHDTQLKHVANTQGGEFAGPCPFCGGSDRFRVQPNRRPWGLWMCRNCTNGKWQNAIDYVIKRDGGDFKAACAVLAGGDLPTTKERRTPPPTPAKKPPAADWQEQARRAIEICHKNLWDAPALDYLLGRGLSDKTIERYRLGFSPGANFGSLYIRRGIVIPCVAAGEVWYLKISLLTGDPVKCKRCNRVVKARQPCPSCGEIYKYWGVEGNQTAAIFGADDLDGASMAVFCEGEFDAMIAYQALGGALPFVTMGSATNHPDLAAWGAYLIGLDPILTLYDNDSSGRAGAAWMEGLSNRVKDCRLPEGVKDINDFYTDGGDLWAWLNGELDRLGILEIEKTK